MKRVVLIGGFLIALMVAEFIVGFQLGKSSELVVLKLSNKSAQEIKSAEIEYDNGEKIIWNIPKGHSVIAKYQSDRKSMYRLIVKFKDNKTISSQFRAAGPGFFNEESITDSLIISKKTSI